MRSGFARRWEIPAALRLRTSLNSLELLGGYLLVAEAFDAGLIQRGSCILVQGDSTSAAGWLRKSNFNDESPFHLWLARELARLVMENGCVLYSQWFPGEDNIVADCLSRDHHLSNLALTHLLYSHAPEQMPPDFLISPLSPKLLSRVTSALQKLPPSTESPKAPQRSHLATGGGMWSTSEPWNSMATSSWRSSPPTTGPRPYRPSLPPTRTSNSVLPIFKSQASCITHMQSRPRCCGGDLLGVQVS